MTEVRPLRLLEAVRLNLPNGSPGPNWAETKERLARRGRQTPTSLELLQGGWRAQPRRVSLVLEDGGELLAVASARRSPGSRVWEVDLLSHAPRAEARGGALLEALIAEAGRWGGHRVVVRLPVESPLAPLAQNAGFAFCVRETLYRATRPLPALPKASLPLRRRHPSDDASLFRLYCQAVPSPVRVHEAWTLEQWQEAQKGFMGSRRDLVWQVEEGVVAWIRLQTWGAQMMAELLLHPQWQGSGGALVEEALQRGQGYLVSWLVPEYQETLARQLEERSFVAEGEHLFLVRPLTAPLRSRAVVPSRVPG